MMQAVVLVIGAAPDTLTLLQACRMPEGADILYARDLEGARVAAESRDAALLMVDRTYRPESLHGVLPLCGGDTIPAVLLLLSHDDSQIISSLINDFPYIAVDVLRLPATAELLSNRIKMLLEFAENKRLLQEKERELNDRSLEIEVLRAELAEKTEMLDALSSRDSLTGLFNRPYFEDNLVKEWKQGVRSGASLAMLVVEVDMYEEYRSSYGPLEGDECLRQVGIALYETLLRPDDIIARYDGAQFAVMLPDTDAVGLQKVASRMMKNVGGIVLAQMASQVDVATISVGGSVCVPQQGQNPVSLIVTARKNLEEAKAGESKCYLTDGGSSS